MVGKARSTAAGPMGFILGLCHREHARKHCVRGCAFGPGPVAVLVGRYGGDLRVVLGAVRCEGMGATECCSASIGKENTPGRCFYRECYAFALWCVGAVLCGQRLADHTLGIFEE